MVELNEHTRWILVGPNVACSGIANRLRELGHEIARKAEDEQAVVIHWMLTMYEQHGPAWRDAAEKYLEEPVVKLATDYTHN